jgi:hypothetical protein
VAEIPIVQFSVAVFSARFARFLAEGLLAFFYGEAAAAWIRSHAKAVGIDGTLIAIAALAGWIWWARRKRL